MTSPPLTTVLNLSAPMDDSKKPSVDVVQSTTYPWKNIYNLSYKYQKNNKNYKNERADVKKSNKLNHAPFLMTEHENFFTTKRNYMICNGKEKLFIVSMYFSWIRQQILL